MAIKSDFGCRHYVDAPRQKSMPTCSLPATSRSRHARAAARGSERSIALHSARWPRRCVGDGQTDASGGGFDHRMMDIKYRERKTSDTGLLILTDNSQVDMLVAQLGLLAHQFDEVSHIVVLSVVAQGGAYATASS